jgi:predicted alpha/beta hydrolase
MTSVGEQTWFRSGSRTLEGWVHRPDDGRVVGAVVIAGPFAHEALVAYRAIRVLAVQAARRGFVAVRFGWSGTGDSEPAPSDLALATAWQQDLAAAAELARAASGLQAVDAIGVRFGAAVVDAAGGMRRRVLWDPLGGRAYLRMQSSLLTLHLPDWFPRAPQGIELGGEILDEEQAASVRALPDPRSRASDPDADRGRVILEDDAQTTAELFGGAPQDARVPLPSITRALDALVPDPEAALPDWTPQREALSTDPVSGRRIRQTLLAVGPRRSPGILTEPADGSPAGVAALFVPFANEPKGMNRLCRATSVRLGGGGVTTLRVDRRGIGDAADPDDLVESPTFDEAGVEDIAESARWLADRTGKPIVGIGLCSGAWFVARAAALAPVQRVLLVNNKAWSTSPRYWDRQARILGRLRDAAVIDENDHLELARAGEAGLARRLKVAARFGAPYPVRHRVFSRWGRDEVPELLLGAMSERTSVRLVLGPLSDQQYWEAARGPESARRLTRRGRRIDVEYDPRLDHSLLSVAGYDAYIALLEHEFRLPTSATLTSRSPRDDDGPAAAHTG